MTHKIWIHSRGPGVRRPSHIEAEDRYAKNPCPIDDPFVIDGVSLMYPRDFSCGVPAETINCQCLQISRRLSVAAAAAPPNEQFVTYADLVKARSVEGANNV
jgi:hypothetical protein